VKFVWVALFLLAVVVGSVMVWQGFGLNERGPFKRPLPLTLPSPPRGGEGGLPAGQAGGEGVRRCSGCEKGEYPYLLRGSGSRSAALCGRNAVQIIREQQERLDFQNLARKLSPLGAVKYNDYLLKASISPFEITVFQNGRAIIQGTEDAAQAKSVYARYIGG